MNKIHMIKRHHNGNTTVVIGKHCINGCQMFHESKSRAVFRKFKVSTEHQQDVITLFDQYDPNENWDFVQITAALRSIRPYMKEQFILLLLSNYKSPQLIDFLFNSDDPILVWHGVKHFSKAQLEVLTKSSSNMVCCEVAKHGYGLDILVNDLEWIIRLEVTKRCNKKLLDILVNDIADLVRAEVAKRGNKNT